MPLLAVGVNHKTAPVEVREQISLSADRLPHALLNLTGNANISEAAIISTCNRTELFCGANESQVNEVIEWIQAYHSLAPGSIHPYLYIHSEQMAVRHILRVASGLDSMILGEPQILGQIKDAYACACDTGTVGRLLNKLFQHTFAVAKQVRTDTAIGASAVSVAFAAVNLAKQIFSHLSNRTALLIGAGETIELTARHLHTNGIKQLIIANRTVERAHTLASELNGYAIALSEIPSHLIEADIVISSTASQLPILGKGTVESALKSRKHNPILMVDIAVPRDIEPEVATLEDIYLYTVDDLKEIIDEGLKSRREAAQQAEEIIDTQVSHFMGWLKSLTAVETIRNLRNWADSIRQQEINKSLALLKCGHHPEKVIEALSRSLTNKLTHAPSVSIRKAGFEGRPDIVEIAREILDIEEPNS